MITIIALGGTTLLLAGLLIWFSIKWDKERKDLLNRIMSRDYTDLTNNMTYTNMNRTAPTAQEIADAMEYKERGLPVS